MPYNYPVLFPLIGKYLKPLTLWVLKRNDYSIITYTELTVLMRILVLFIPVKFWACTSPAHDDDVSSFKTQSKCVF